MTLPILNMTAFSDVRISTKRGDEGKIMNDESSIYSFTKLATGGFALDNQQFIKLKKIIHTVFQE